MKNGKKYDVIVDTKLCKKCGICVFVCPKTVFSLSEELEVNSGSCTGCRKCETYCPDFAIEIVGSGNEDGVENEYE